MNRSKLWAVVVVMSMMATDLRAAVPQADINQAISQVTTDSALLSGWLADQFRYIVPFNSTAGMTVPEQLNLFGIDVGVSAAVSGTKIDVDGLRRLNTTIVNSNDIDMLDRFPFPALVAHAKVGLPFGLDGGVRLGGIPKKKVTEEDTEVEVKNKIIGFDVRKKIIEEGVTRPFGLTVGLSYTHADGDVTATSDYTSNLGTTVVGNAASYSSTLAAIGTDVMEWNTNSWTLHALLNKKILFLNPYLGASATRNFGSVTNTLTTAGTLTVTDVANAANTASQSISTVGSASRSANKWDMRALFGIDFSILPFVKLGLQGEYAGSKNIAGAIGLRAHFNGLKSN